LQSARAILLLPSAYPTREEVVSLAMLARALKHNQKSVTLVLPGFLKSSFRETAHWPNGLKEAITSRSEVTIALDVERHPIHALRYEQEGQYLYISLNAGQPFPKPEDFVIRAPEKDRFESLVVLGAPTLELISRRSELEPILTESTLINIDTDPANEGFGDFNVIVEGGLLYATIQRLIGLFPAIPPDLDEWQKELARQPIPLPGLHMLGRMLARLTEERGIWSSMLTENDFEQSQLSHERFIEILPRLPLEDPFFPKPYGALWAAGGAIQCVIVGEDKRLYARISQRIPGTYGFEGYRSSFETEHIESARTRLMELLS
jgi:hypothetical protein